MKKRPAGTPVCLENLEKQANERNVLLAYLYALKSRRTNLEPLYMKKQREFDKTEHGRDSLSDAQPCTSAHAYDGSDTEPVNGAECAAAGFSGDGADSSPAVPTAVESANAAKNLRTGMLDISGDTRLINESANATKNLRTGMLWLCLTFLWCAVIFWFSSRPAAVSSEQSGFIVRLIYAVSDTLGAERIVDAVGIDLLTHLVRKTAHFTVYFVLGLLAFQTAVCMCSGGVRNNLYRQPGKAGSAGDGKMLRKGGKAEAQSTVCRKHTVRNCMWIAIAFCALYAASDELHQYFVPGRAAMWQDVLLDSCASAIACALRYWISG